MFFANSDLQVSRQLIKRTTDNINREARLKQVDEMNNLCVMQEGCRHDALLRFFGESLSGGRCVNSCDLCLEDPHPLLRGIPNADGENNGQLWAPGPLSSEGVLGEGVPARWMSPGGTVYLILKRKTLVERRSMLTAWVHT